VKMSRAWAMPHPDTFTIKPIGEFVARWLSGVSIDPFARNSRLCTHTNDINPNTVAGWHLPADEFLARLMANNVAADTFIFDPPYSPRQISECYRDIGREVTAVDTQNARLYKNIRDAADLLIKPGGVALSFGWNSAGMGKTRGYAIEEILIVAHGGAHNDTICMAERKSP